MKRFGLNFWEKNKIRAKKIIILHCINCLFFIKVLEVRKKLKLLKRKKIIIQPKLINSKIILIALKIIKKFNYLIFLIEFLPAGINFCDLPRVKKNI